MPFNWGQSATITYRARSLGASPFAGIANDQANHALTLYRDGIGASPANTPADSGNGDGIYVLVLSSAEMQMSAGRLIGKSTTANVFIDDVVIEVMAPNSVGSIPSTINFPIPGRVPNLVIVQGDDYFNADGRALAFNLPAGEFPSLAGATITGEFKQSPSNTADGTSSFTASGAVTQSGSGPQAGYIQVAASVTAAMAVGGAAYQIDIIATLSNGHVVTLIRTGVNVEAQL